MEKLTRAFHKAHHLTLALAVLVGVGAALWRLTENTRLKRQYLRAWHAGAAKVRRPAPSPLQPPGRPGRLGRRQRRARCHHPLRHGGGNRGRALRRVRLGTRHRRGVDGNDPTCQTNP